MRYVKGGLSLLVLVGVARGVIRYQENSTDGGIVRIVVSAVQAVEDITVKAIPAAIGLLQQLAS